MARDLAVSCATCGYPVITEYYTRTPRKGSPAAASGVVKGGVRKVTVRQGAPKTEEEALAKGWLETERGLVCPDCGKKVNEEIAKEKEEGGEGGAGIGTMAAALVNQSDPEGKTQIAPIADEDVVLEATETLPDTGITFIHRTNHTGVAYLNDEQFNGYHLCTHPVVNQKYLQDHICTPYNLHILDIRRGPLAPTFSGKEAK